MHEARRQEGVVAFLADILEGADGVLVDELEVVGSGSSGVVVECAASAADCEEGVGEDRRGPREVVCAVVPVR